MEVAIFTSASDLRSAAGEAQPDAVICGLKVSSADGLDVLRELEASDPDLVGLVMTSITDEDGAARAIAAVGPLNHVRKPCDMADLLPKLRVGLKRRSLTLELRRARQELRARDADIAESARKVARATAELESKHTELATATERLVQAEQLAAVGRVVTGIAHELARQLALVGYAEAIKSRVADDPELFEFADIIVNAQKRLAAMVDEIRDFTSAQGNEQAGSRLDREPADVAAVGEEALAIMGYDRDVRKRIIACEFRSRPLCALHRQKFAQVVINLVSNAVLATEAGDTLQVELDSDEGAEGGPVAVLAVTDRGVGMPAEIVARLGEPFFTTRGDRGSGLGVGICMRIVEEHGGKLTYRSEVGAGTTALVTIPLLTEAASLALPGGKA